MNSKELRAEIERRHAVVWPLLGEIAQLEYRHAEAASREFIAEHGITADQVQSSREPRIFMNVWAYGESLHDTACTKPWAEWNGRLYSTADLKGGDFSRETPGLAEHVPGYSRDGGEQP